MDHKTASENLKSNVIYLKRFKKKLPNEKISSTIAAIIAVNVTHPENISPEDFFIDKIENHKSLEIVAFEDALEEIIEPSNTDENKVPVNYLNDA